MSHSFIQNCRWITLQIFTSPRMKNLCKKWKVKLNFRGAYRLSGTGIVECLKITEVGCNLKIFMAWPDWPWPPYFTTDSHPCFSLHRRHVLSLFSSYLPPPLSSSSSSSSQWPLCCRHPDHHDARSGWAAMKGGMDYSWMMSEQQGNRRRRCCGEKGS